MAILETDSVFDEYLNKVRDYISVVYIKGIEELNPSDKKYNPYDDPLKDSSHISINYKYIHTNIDISKDTFQKAIELNHYVDNECWINSIYFFIKIRYCVKRKDIELQERIF